MGLPSTSGRDRTSEFHAIVDRLRKTQGSTLPYANGGANGAAGNGHAGETARLLPQPSGGLQSEFSRRASQIGLSIHQTSQKLSKLAKLAKRTSMFDDPAVEIQELTSVVKQDITALNAAISDLQQVCDSRHDAANQTKQSTEHSTTVVNTLKSRLMTTTEEFKEVLTLRTESLKVHENRRQLFTASPNKPTNPYARQGPLATVADPSSSTSTSVAIPPWGNGATRNTELFSSRRRHATDGSDSSQSQGRLQQQQMVPVQDSYMQNRAEALQNVESTITELSNIFTQLATMVAQQGEVAIRIDENMDESLTNVEGAQTQLLKYLNSISSNRWLILKIFMVLITFLLIFVVFVA
ncbi:hypothetical protein M758_4G161900 [Ceratodon purpureus]|nr:hypothetical protein M758_4G161900 [Ceratodon purpureus]